MKHLLPLLAAAAFLAGSAHAQTPLPPDLAKAVHDYDQAQIDGNEAELNRLLADDYVLANSSGATETKQQFISESIGPQNKLDPFTVEQPIEKVWDNGAVMAGVATISGLSGGTPFKVTLRFSDIWAKRNGTWQVIYTHASRQPG